MGGQTRQPRFRVSIYGRIRPDAPLGTIDVTQDFTARHPAERFSREISKLLPTGPDIVGCVQAWVLVYALPLRASGMRGHCYLSYDAGGVLVKRHLILPGFHGHGAPMSVVHA